MIKSLDELREVCQKSVNKSLVPAENQFLDYNLQVYNSYRVMDFSADVSDVDETRLNDNTVRKKKRKKINIFTQTKTKVLKLLMLQYQ